VNIRFFITKAG